jgi:hypothetical protein
LEQQLTLARLNNFGSLAIRKSFMNDINHYFAKIANELRINAIETSSRSGLDIL